MSSVHPFLSILVHWFLRCQCSILSSPVWHVLFTLIHRSNITGSYAILFFTASDFLLSPPDISTAEHCFCIGPATSFFLELLVIALYSSPIAYWIHSDLRAHLPVSHLFAFSYCPWGSPGKNTGMISFLLPVDHILSELLTMTHLSWVAQHHMTHSLVFICLVMSNSLQPHGL